VSFWSKVLVKQSDEERIHEDTRDVYRAFKESLILGAPHIRSVDKWLEAAEITNYEIEKFPNAKAAAEIKNSPLYKAMK
jgi:hypothetical protein